MCSQQSKCFLNQFHRGISCSEEQFELFENECARGAISSCPIDYSIPVEQLPGFALISSSEISPMHLYRFTTAITDFMAYVSNSDLQKEYSRADLKWKSIRLKSGMTSNQFHIAEEECFADFCDAAAAAQRSAPSHLDRGIHILKILPVNMKTTIQTRSRKRGIPENLMHRDWVMAQVKQCETESDLVFSWFGSQQPCHKFLDGTCTMGDDCKYLHTGPIHKPSLTDPQITITAPPVGACTDADDVNIVCRLQIAPDCQKTFTTQRSYWAKFKTSDGEPFSIPKSCKSCRDFKKQEASLFTAEFASDHENDFDEDYFDHCLSCKDLIP